MWVSDNQAIAIDKAFVKREPVKVNGATINTVDISGIWPEDTWYDMHPELRPQPIQETPLRLEQAISDTDKGVHYEAFSKNLKLLKDGKKPIFFVKDGVIQKNKEGLVSNPKVITDVPANWVKQGVSKQKWNTFYSASPGYKKVSDNGDQVIVAFTVVGEIPHYLEKCNELEIKKLEIRR